MKLLITGASGFVGSATVRAALGEGHEVVAAVRPGSPAARLKPLNGRFVRIDCDLNSPRSVRFALDRARPDAVIHLAWNGVGSSVHPARLDRLQIAGNVEPACSIVESAAAAGVATFVGLGSQAEYGNATNMQEDVLPTPTTLYGAAKVAAFFLTRQIAAQAEMRHVWLRLFPTYGPEDNKGLLIPTLITEMLAGRRPRTTSGTQSIDYLHVDDAARGIIAITTSSAEQGIFNLGSGRARRVREVIEMIRDLAAPEIDLVFGEIPFHGHQSTFVQADIGRIRNATGWAPRLSMEQGLEETVAWYRTNAI